MDAQNRTPFSIATPTVTSLMSASDDISDMLSPGPDMRTEQTAEDTQAAPGENPTLQASNTAISQSQQTDASNTSALPPPPPPPPPAPQPGETSQQQQQQQQAPKKRNKSTKKSAKLDAKSKLEKSRQSARECRARKKLRYQYLEDLVTNREKAVVKLREELTMFCELARQIDVGSISNVDKRLLLMIDQTKENAPSDL